MIGLENLDVLINVIPVWFNTNLTAISVEMTSAGYNTTELGTALNIAISSSPYINYKTHL